MDGFDGLTSETMPEKGVVRFPVAELFHTLQGEGANAGTAAVFVRLGGCSNGCPWCDSEEAQTTRNCKWMTAGEIAESVAAFGARTAVITGGEPLLRCLDGLTAALRECGVKVFLETSGSAPLSGRFDWICLSPKRFAPPLEELFGAADELKVVVCDERDFDYAEECARKVRSECRLFLQPEWGGRSRTVPATVDYVKSHPQWRLSLQTHKFIDIP